ncbi:MAG: MarR family transcriptional regulator [Treponema sp.]|nr:MarR family transcriptional regulator [Treponema sp.]
MENKEILFMIKNIHDRFEARGNADCKEAGLTFSQFRVLIYLQDHKNKIVTQKELEVDFKVSHPTINGIISRLENNNFIETKIIKEAGKQQKQIFLTQKSSSALINMNKNQIHDDKMLSEEFTPEEMTKLLDYLKRLYKAISY